AMRQAVANSEAATVRREQEIVQGARQQTVEVLTVSFKSDYLFATDSATLMPGAQPELQRVADVLRQYPETNIQIAGHTDSQGNEVYNQQLSERRAQAVRTALVGMGVDPSRVTTIGYGESRPIVGNDTASGRQQNRRVEVRVVLRDPPRDRLLFRAFVLIFGHGPAGAQKRAVAAEVKFILRSQVFFSGI
ncbi:MAG: outer membrane protein OmpA/peptidoglycan-associated protein, partial [Deltaproteobacteria bacterium]|nr:outer membrane protein OmpA/peptidoglycan-associated protein [Deltaproteobacteria bacterium]